VKERFAETNAVIELNGLKIAEDRTFADCARYIFTAMLQVRGDGSAVGICGGSWPAGSAHYTAILRVG
jgi:hypothetical protein